MPEQTPPSDVGGPDSGPREEQPFGDLLREIAAGVKSNSHKLDHLEQEQGRISEKLGYLEQEQGKIGERLGHLEQAQSKISERLGRLEQAQSRTNERLEHMEREQEKTNIIVETYQKASGQVVNLAFGLIATATITLILSTILGK